MSSVLEAPPPRFSAGDVARIAAQLFGLDVAVVDLGSERDQTFLAQGAAGSGVVKISNSEEKAATLDLEAEAILHVSRVDPDLPVARPRVVSKGEGAAAYRTTVEGPDGLHFVRLFERLPGRVLVLLQSPALNHRAAIPEDDVIEVRIERKGFLARRPNLSR